MTIMHSLAPLGPTGPILVTALTRASSGTGGSATSLGHHARERTLLEELAACSAELAAVAADVQRALDTDEELVTARFTLRGYTTADAEERSELDSLCAQRSAIVEPTSKTTLDAPPGSRTLGGV